MKGFIGDREKVFESKGRKGDNHMSQLLDEILSSENMKLAYKKVKSNKGASGIDGISTDEVSSYLKEHWLEIHS